MIVLKQYILNDYIKDDVRMVNPMMEINGFKVRPGFFDLNGASEFSCGVNFTVHTSNGTSCDLLLFHPEKKNHMQSFHFQNHIRSEMSIL